MEAAGLGIGVVGLAGLFGTVRDIHEAVNSYKEFDLESRPHFVQRDAAKASYQQWSESVGYDQGELKDNHHKALDSPAVLSIVREIVQCIHEIDGDAGNNASHISSQSRPADPASRDPHSRRKKPVQLEKFQGSASRRTKLAWALGGKEKISNQTELVAALLQYLRELVPPQQPSDTGHTQIGPEAHAIETLSSRLQQTIRMLEDNEEKRRIDDFKRGLASWLGTTWTTTMYDTFIQRRLHDTCDWIFERSEFRNWEATDSSGIAKVLWIHGPAGYGKTILCARVVEHLAAHFPLAYYFFSSDSDSRADPLVIVRSWISQRISQDQQAFALARGRWEATEGRPASQVEIMELFTLIAQSTPNCIFIVDGLDECAGAGHDGKADHWSSLIGFLTSLKQAVSNVKSRLIVVSRNEPDIRDGLRAEVSGANWDLVECCIGPDDVRPDATLFSQSIVDQKLRNKSQAQREDLARKMVDRSESMFLWIKMLDGQLRGGKGQGQLQRAVEQAPTNLGSLYDRNWRRITELPDADRDRAMAIIRWATFALRPMTILEITNALLLVDAECDDLLEELPDAIDNEYIATEILDLCASLIETRGTSSDPAALTIHLTHFSVRQYILCCMPAPGDELLPNEQLRAGNEKVQSNVLAIICLRYLTNYNEVWEESWEESRQGEKSRMIRAFRQYATDSWYRHTERSAFNFKGVIEHANAFFDPSCTKWEGWRKLGDPSLQDDMLQYQGNIQSGSRLFYASLLGMLETMTYLIENAGLDIDHIDGSNRTALLAAASKSWSLGIIRLLEQGANPDIASNEGRTPVYVAARNGHLEVVRLLLEKRADLTVPNNNGWTPLNSASNNGHLEVVRLLLEKGADLAVPSNDGWTPIYAASFKGHLEVVRLLLEKGADLAVPSNDGWTPIYAASSKGHLEVVRLLLEKGADPAVPIMTDGRH
ncbi:uncharacterized protein F4822DRAFT_62342 [Hypoxylon trugodes]|uniref:uncharacterized protein n=1 Tax=Hypoxylon trugodes TaxID=326681 RepID=UPI00219F7817|nr:uncharacterized protein F4822DRAFT_62342 [Hypoxylon trugodes]KAI1384141.1 hypothetical protein F4822DRAFT_62342 [Hypoxylon trugodes]